MLPLIVIAVLSQVAAEPVPVRDARLTPEYAATRTLEDMQGLDPADQRFQRYIWLPEPTKERKAAVGYTVNTALVSATTLYRPAFLDGGRLCRLDARRIAPRADDLTRFLTNWEKFVTEPHFHLRGVQEVKVAVSPYKAADGKTYDFTLVKQAAFGLHVDPKIMLSLVELTGSQAPIIRYDEFLFRALSSVDDGLYYEFANIGKGAKNDLDKFLEQAGASVKQVEAQRSDERSAMWASLVTGKPRQGMFFYGTNTRPSMGLPIVTLTFDIFDEDNDPERNPLQNLLNFKSRASEVITVKPNGMLRYGLFNDKGERQDSVPDKVAKDHTIPRPHTGRLQAAISCIRCHGPHEGWQPFPNAVQAMLKAGGNVFDDESSKLSPEDTLDILAGRYTGDLDEPLRLLRNAHARSSYIATGGLSTAAAAEAVADAYGEYAYIFVTPATACRELGYPVEGEADAVKVLKQVLPLLPPNRLGKRTEDPAIIALKAWTPETPLQLTRKDWNRVFADAMLRVRTQEAINLKR